MSRAAWAALIIGAVFVIGIVVLLLMPGHLRPELISRAERQSDRFGKLLASYKQDEKRLGKLIKAYPKYMNAQPEVKQVLFQMRMRKSSLDRGEKILKEVDAIIKKDRQENNHDLRVAFNKLGNLHLIESSRAKKVAAMIKDVVRVRGYRSEAAAIHKRALADAKRVATDMPPDALVDKLRALRRTNPTASGYIARRIASVPRQRQQALAIFKQHQVAFGATPKKYVRAGRQAEALHSLVVKMDSQIKSAEQSLADLDHDVDKILVDMQRAATKCAAGVCSNTHHRYKIVRDGKVTTSGWLPVKLAYYRTHEKDLGLVLSSKPRGIVDEQANHYAHPPGYNYVGRQGYGYWKHPGDPSTPPPTAGGAAPGAAAPPPG
ncbi:MAG: hypothetical protein KC503_19165, partial [Myxococcales bacterium]|nr:hypothetical protein [Myxococcales bacterium]